MTKFLTTLVAAIFAAVSFTAVAASAPAAGDTPTAQAKKKTNKPAKKAPKGKKSSTK